MAHFAKIDDVYVTEVLVVDNSVVDNLPFPESEPIGQAYLQALFGANTVWQQTSYNGNFRYNYAGIGYTFDAAAQPNGAFIAPYPGEGWVLDTTTYGWVKQPASSEAPAVL